MMKNQLKNKNLSNSYLDSPKITKKEKKWVEILIIGFISYIFLMVLHEIGHCLVLLIFGYDFTYQLNFVGILFIPTIKSLTPINNDLTWFLFISSGFFIQLIFIFLCLAIFTKRKSTNARFNRIIVIQILLNTITIDSYLLIDLFFLRIGDFHVLLRDFPLFFYLLMNLMIILSVYEIIKIKKFWSEIL